ncbi:MAG: FAD/NAD(P)-binding protein [Actinobacteria bacterium]|nr:FAD/NAD(P)-binding protein [Actinomycetota bacterium]
MDYPVGTDRPLRIAIVGGGPSATYALERLDAVFSHGSGPARPLTVHLFERTGEFGPGQVHSARQPRSSYLNRISAQVSFAADPASAGVGWVRPASQRPTLHEWCRRRYSATGCEDFDLAPEDWPRRYVHGLALAEQFEAYCTSLAAAGVDVHRHPVEVTDVIDEQAHLLVCAGPSRIAVDRILFATGHPVNDPDRDPEQLPLAEFARRCPGVRYLANVYPLEQTLDSGRVGPADRVGVLGMGLTAIDVLLYLTEGRGGTFVRESSGRLRYLPSGAEPAAIVAFSRSGLFTTARPLNQKQRDPGRLEHRGRFLTDAHVEAVRHARGQPAPPEAVAAGNRGHQLEFEADLLPLIVLEMAYVYYRVLLGEAVAHRLAEAVARRLATFLHAGELEPAGVQAWQWLLEPVQQVAEQALRTDGKYAPGRAFSWQRLLDPLPWQPGTSAVARREAVLRFMRADDRDAAQGNLANPAKAAADGVWRDLRPVIARAIDFGGLTAPSHRRFLEHYLPLHNHLANGAAREVMEKIMALVEAGVVDVGIGPKPRVRLDESRRAFQVLAADGAESRQVNVLVAARVHPFKAELAAGPLYRNLMRRGLVSEWMNSSGDGTTFVPGGLRLDRRLHPRRPDGTSDDRLTFLGPPSEGARFFQLGALRPDSDHHVMQDVLGWVAGLPLAVMAESR